MSREIQDKLQIIIFCGWIDHSSKRIHGARSGASELTQSREIFLCAGHRWRHLAPISVWPATTTGHRPQSRTRRNCTILGFPVTTAGSLSWMHTFPSYICSFLLSVYSPHRRLSVFPFLTSPCLQHFAYAVPSTWNGTCSFFSPTQFQAFCKISVEMSLLQSSLLCFPKLSIILGVLQGASIPLSYHLSQCEMNACVSSYHLSPLLKC